MDSNSRPLRIRVASTAMGPGGERLQAELERAITGACAASSALRQLAVERPDGMLLVDSEGTLRFADRGATDLFSRHLQGCSLGSLAPASGLEAFVRDARIDAREGYRFEINSSGGRGTRSLSASVVPLVTVDDQAHAGFRAVLLFDADSRGVAEELFQVQQQGFPRRELGPLLEAARRVYHPGRILGVSAGMVALRGCVMEAARASEHVLVRGPAGTGKEFVARTLHFGGNCTGFLVPLDCGAPSELAQADVVFGRVKPSLEGSLGDHPGLLHQAHQGTLFLKRVEALSLEVQAGLLRAIERGEVCRVGSEDVERVEVRVIASSCADLGECVSEGSFLKELHSRLCAVELVLPPLIARPGDLEVLAHAFADGSPASHTRPAFSKKALAALLAHDWPGNVRELRECVEQACALAGGGEIDLEHLPMHFCAAEHQAPLAGAAEDSESQGPTLEGMDADVELTPQAPCDLNLKSYERQCLLAALSHTAGDKLDRKSVV